MATTRRQFLIDGMQMTAAVPLTSAALSAVDLRRSPRGDRALVVIQLSGGNDGLNTIVPFRQDAYFRMRPTLSLSKNSLHALDDDHGLHPELRGLSNLYNDGSLAVVNGVGYPDPDRSHFRSMEIWHTADPTVALGEASVGWMGRLADEIALTNPGSLAALHVGSGDLPLALYARDSFAPTARDDSGFRLRGSDAFANQREKLLEPDGGEPELAFLRAAARTTYAAAERMAHAADRESNVEYPGYGLAQRLRLVAKLITGGFDTRLFHLELGGFDTHARQAPAHADLLRELSESLTAFQRDLDASHASGRVVTLVFSEFGRRAAENGSRGTDHGAGAPAFLLGGSVRGGMHGAPPDVNRLEQGDIPFSTDFRSVYSMIEESWLGLSSSSAIEPLDLLS